MEEMFIGTNANGLIVGDPTVLARAAVKDVESEDMIRGQLITSSTEVTPYVDEQDAVETVSFSDVVKDVELEPCM